MPKNDREIEIKIKIQSNEPLLRYLKEHGEFKQEKHQTDQYFTPAHKDFFAKRPASEYLRLRKEDASTSINYKNFRFRADGTALDCDEYELEIDDLRLAEKMFAALDFKPLVTVNKLRKTYMTGDYEIAIDSVEGLGDYVEVEYKADSSEADAEQITTEMRQFIENMGCVITEQEFLGYPLLLWEKQHGK